MGNRPPGLYVWLSYQQQILEHLPCQSTARKNGFKDSKYKVNTTFSSSAYEAKFFYAIFLCDFNFKFEMHNSKVLDPYNENCRFYGHSNLGHFP